jgi:hypothetical protein
VITIGEGVKLAEIIYGSTVVPVPVFVIFVPALILVSEPSGIVVLILGIKKKLKDFPE